jgi:hypothetical protein
MAETFDTKYDEGKTNERFQGRDMHYQLNKLKILLNSR